MDEILPDIDSDLDVIFGEYRDRQVVDDFVAAIRNANFTGTLYIGYPVLSIDDGRIEFDALLVSRDRGVIIFDLYSFSGQNVGDSAAIPQLILDRQEQLHAALFNKLNSFRDLRSGRRLIVDLTTLSVHPLADTFVEDQDCFLVGLNKLPDLHSIPQEEWLNDNQIMHLNAAVQRISNLRPPKKRDNVEKANSKGAVIKEIEKQIANLDLWQKRGSIEYVNGPQRIRGLAGSGKTVVLALKAAYLHVKRPDWNIVVTFNTRSLYQQFEALINRFVFSQIGDEPDWSKIRIMHAWGASDRDGIYREAARESGAPYRDFGTAAKMFGYETAFDGACFELLKHLGEQEPETYDIMLVDEAQDLPRSFFKLAYKLVNSPKRIVWAYDDLQNLGDVHMPSEGELFGHDNDGRQLVKLTNERDQPQHDIVLPRCYRNPPWTLVAAHGLGFGVKHQPMIQMFPDPKLWTRLGYTVEKGDLSYGKRVCLKRNPKSVPDFFGRLLEPATSLEVRNLETAEDQYAWVANEISRLIQEEELHHSDFMVVIPDVRRAKGISIQVMKALAAVGLEGHIPGQTSSRDEIFRENSIAITHIFRAKGNEAPVVFVIDAQFCEFEYGSKKRRNILFTAMTRSRAWTYITGYGEGISTIVNEFDAIKSDGFALDFNYPTREEIDALAVSAEINVDELSPVGDDFDDVRSALRKAKELPWEQLPLDLRQEFQEIYGPGK